MMEKGECLCGAVAFEFDADPDRVIACHCRQCRRQSGHYFSAVAASKAGLRFDRDDGLKWYRASDIARRGFCGTCGSTLFWWPDEGPVTMVAMGSLEAPTGLRLGGHYWVNAKGDYYDIADGLPQEGR